MFTEIVTNSLKMYWRYFILLSRLLINGLFIPLYGAIQRFEDGNFEATFDVMYDARMLNALMYFLQMELNECLYKCMIHRDCITVNHNDEKRICELVGREFDEEDVVKSKGWMNFRPRPKVDGGYSEWKTLTSCQRTCGNRTQQLYRECNNPPPQYGGRHCEGPEVKTVKCDCPGYTIEVKTSNVRGAGTDANVFIKLTGDKDFTEDIKLSPTTVKSFERNTLDTFSMTMIDIGKIKKLEVWHDNKKRFADWKVEYININVNGCTVRFDINEWFREDELRKEFDNPNEKCE